MRAEGILSSLGGHFLSLTERGFVYGPQGLVLLRNLEQSWFSHSVTQPRYDVFLADQQADAVLQQLRRYGGVRAPFGLAWLAETKPTWRLGAAGAVEGSPQSHRVAKVTVLEEHERCKDLFHKIQRERKVWWRRMAQYPSRFGLSEARREKGADQVLVEAEFEFGKIVVESITLADRKRQIVLTPVGSEEETTEVRTIEHTTSLDWGCVALLCDAYAQKEGIETQIHTKLAPYKVAFRVDVPQTCLSTPVEDPSHEAEDHGEAEAKTAELGRLVSYLSNTLRSKGVSTILTESAEAVDAYLVPFTVLVDRRSLEHGVVRVRSRATSLCEEVHVTDLARHVSAHC